MTEQIIVALIAFLGTLLGTLGGILASSKLTNYRIEQLEKKVDKHTGFAEKIPTLQSEVGDLKKRVENLERYHKEKI
jgi:ABC-type lipoprotein release transport system permease subunit